MSGNHDFYERLKYFHSKVSQTEDGACLSKHESVYRKDNSCSYRWQGREKAKGISHVYNIPQCLHWHIDQSSKCAYAEATIKNMDQDIYEFSRDSMGQLVSFLSKKKKLQLQQIVALNFTNGYVPYTNEVHHVLPEGILNQEIDKIDSVLKSRQGVMRFLIQAGLLRQKFNLNYKDNMIILPQGKKISKTIGLPTHKGSHPKYDSNLMASIQKALNGYKEIAEQIENGEPHDKVNPKKLKDDLVGISQKLYTALVNYGQTELKGQQSAKINEIPNHIFNGL